MDNCARNFVNIISFPLEQSVKELLGGNKRWLVTDRWSTMQSEGIKNHVGTISIQ